MAVEVCWLELKAFCLKMPTALQLRCGCQNVLCVTFISKVLLAVSLPEIEKIPKAQGKKMSLKSLSGLEVYFGLSFFRYLKK